VHAAPNCHAWSRDLRQRSHEPAPVPPAQVSRVRTLMLWILMLTECARLNANKSPPRLSRTAVRCRKVARYGRLGHCETEHQKLAMDPWRTPKEVLALPSVQSGRGLREKPWAARLADDHVTDIAKMRTSRHGASEEPSPAGRSIGFLAMLATTRTARSKTADPTGGSRDDEFRCASTRQFDDAARSLPALALFGFGVRCRRHRPLRWRARHKGRLSPSVRSHQ
jgi:hypothetical protein